MSATYFYRGKTSGKLQIPVAEALTLIAEKFFPYPVAGAEFGDGIPECGRVVHLKAVGELVGNYVIDQRFGAEDQFPGKIEIAVGGAGAPAGGGGVDFDRKAVNSVPEEVSVEAATPKPENNDQPEDTTASEVKEQA